MAKSTNPPPEIQTPVTPVPEVPTPVVATAPRTRPSGLWFGVAFGVLALGGAQVYFMTTVQANLTAQIADLRAQIAELPRPDSALPARLDTLQAQLNDRLMALENRPAAELLQLQKDVAVLQSQSKPFDPTAVVKAAIAAEMTEVRKSADDLRAKNLAMAKSIERDAIIVQIRAALDTGAPFAAILPDMPAVLVDHAATGLPSLSQLRESFPEQARLALTAALQANMGSTWAERVTNFLRAQTGARALTPQAGDDPDAILSRAQAALIAGDLPQALAQVSSLPPEAQAAMQSWTDAATLRQTALDALTAFSIKKD